MIAIINYGAGNLYSVQKAAAYVGGAAVVTDDAQVILGADKVILPGVGAFADGMKGLESRGLAQVVREAVESGKPLLGICLGMQLLFEQSEEQGQHLGLGLLSGKVVLFQQPSVKVPQIGWNQVEICKPSGLLKGIQDGDYLYFNHGYYCIPEDARDVLTMTDYGGRFASSVERELIFGVQFHPEKSQNTGLQILKNFVEL
ncbi:MAG: imidazole glycerol phosphate synthase subunit HisH [Anaerolineales bacterium]|nr:imidazole glycerol phosphate synthase subunit HisH [Anaerolineales bacterium]